MNEKPKIMDHLILREIDGELAIDSKMRELHFINSTGAVIFELCDSTHTVEDFVREISTIFSKTPIDAEYVAPIIMSMSITENLYAQISGGGMMSGMMMG